MPGIGSREPTVVGLNRTQDGSVSVLHGPSKAYSVQKERLTRRKHHWGRLGDVPNLYLRGLPPLREPVDLVVECYSSDDEVADLWAYRDELARALDFRDGVRVAAMSHHLAHLYSAFYPSPFTEAAVMVIDAQGSRVADFTEPFPSAGAAPGLLEVASFYRCERGRVDCLAKHLWYGDWAHPEGLGCFYYLLTRMMFTGEGAEGKVMGLAPFGDPDALGLPDLAVEDVRVRIPDEWLRVFADRARFGHFRDGSGPFDGYDPATQRGGWCLYTVPKPSDLPIPVPPSVSLRRPGGGTGGTPFDIANFDPFDPTPRQTFTHWDGRFVAWLERAGYAVDYCTDLDVHRDGDLALLRGYRLLLSVGHDEYWSDAMRANVERFVAGGPNMAFFSGNTCWWRVAFADEYTFRRLRNWSDRPVPDRPENSLTGVSYRNGGERDYDRHPVHVGFRAQHTDHWVYAGTGLADGDTFGDGPGEYIVGYECDGAHFDRERLARNVPVHPTGDDGTPEDFTILGVGDASASGWGLGNKAATMGVHTGVHNGNGTVFTAATTDWARVLAGGSSPAVDRITRNVLDRLSS